MKHAGHILIAAGIIFIPALCFAQSNQTESLTITTYYPSPYGVYRNLQLNPSSPPTPAAGLSEGVMYYDKDLHLLRYYNNTNQWVNLTGVGGGLWEAVGNNIHNINPGKVMFDGVFNWNGELMWINGNLSLASPTGNNKFYYLRSGDPSHATSRSAFSFVSSGGYTEYLIHHTGNPPLLRIMQGTHSGPTVLADPWNWALVVNGTNVGIGQDNDNLLAPLHIETNYDEGLLILRSGMGTTDQSGVATFTTFKDRVYLAYGCYLDDWWRPDPYMYEGAPNQFAVKFTIWPSGSTGAVWYAADDGTLVWDVNALDLWDEEGTWVSGQGVKLPTKVGPNRTASTPCAPVGTLEYYNDYFWGCTSAGWQKLN